MTTGVAKTPHSGTAIEPTPGAGGEPVGAMTRAIAWLFDVVLINVAAIMTGLGADLILSMFPVSKDLSNVLKPIAAVAYTLWTAAYFVVFWSAAGQTPGARVMQIRLVTADGGRVKPLRALIRWIGMNLAILMLFLGYAPVLVGRRPLPDWLAHTLVLDAPQQSLAEARQAALRATRAASGGRPGARRT
jgi:uncharacterized RDD family membrane protein YckC